MTNLSPSPVAFQPHDHDSCCSDALSRTEERALQAGLRLTPVRRRTLEILLEAHRAMGAYEVLERLSADGFGSQPPVAYRALEFLVENGFAHRIRRLNAFMACTHPDTTHRPMFLICDNCEAVAELDANAVQAEVRRSAETLGFEVERMNLEAVGRCPTCKVDAA